MTETRKAAIYTRVSTLIQAEDGFGLETQLNMCHGMAQMERLEVDEVHICTDEGISGTKDEKDRPGLSKLFKLVEGGKVDAVIFYSIDRLARNTRLTLDLIDRLDKAGITILSCKEKIDTSTVSGELMLTIMAAIAHAERRTIRERLEAGLETRSKKDGERGGFLPYGYDRVPINGSGDNSKAKTKVVINDYEADVVRLIFDMWDSDYSLGKIADSLSEAYYLTKRGGANWWPSTVKSILTNEEKYRGCLRGKSETVHWPVILWISERI